MKLYAHANKMDLRCSDNHEHLVRNHVIDEQDSKHLLKEFPQYLFKKDPNIISEDNQEENMKSSDFDNTNVEVNDG